MNSGLFYVPFSVHLLHRLFLTKFSIPINSTIPNINPPFAAASHKSATTTGHAHFWVWIFHSGSSQSGNKPRININIIWKAYDNANSFEQYQAQTIIQNAVISDRKLMFKKCFFQLVSTFEGSSLRDMNPTIGVEKLENRFTH